VIKFTSLEVGRVYPIDNTGKFDTILEETVIITVHHKTLQLVKAFLPRPYGLLFTEEDIHSINEKSL
jgi:hypothetical protein